MKLKLISILIIIVMLTSFTNCKTNTNTSETQDESTKETSIKETSTVPQNDFVFEETQITEMPKDENDTVPIESILDDVSTEMPTIDIPSTNITLIKDAYESGAIDEPTYSMYAYLAGHDPGELPLEYAMADAETLYDSTYELLYLAENWESLSTDMKSVLEPYL